MIYINIILVCILMDILLEFMRWNMYASSMKLIKYPRLRVTVKLEKIMHKIEYWARKTPCLFIDTYMVILLSDLFKERKVVDVKEKRVITVEIICKCIRCIFKIRIAYILCLLVAIYRWIDREKVGRWFLILFEKLVKVDVGKYVYNTVQFVNTNINFIVVAVLLIIMLYACVMKKQLEAYRIERIWYVNKDKQENEIADAQELIRNEMKSILIALNNNVYIIQKVIRTNNIKHLEELVEYEKNIEQIKRYIKKIEDNAGRKLYLQYNKGIWTQLEKFALTNKDTWEIPFVDIMKCDKNYINRYLKDCSQEDTRELLMNAWVCGVYSLSGLGRCLKYMDKRYIKFCKLQSKLRNVNYIKKEIQDNK